MKELDPKNWVGLYADYLLRYAMFRLNDRNLCEDLVQETFLSAWRAKDGFKGNSSEKTWLTSILRNKIIDEYRKKGKAAEALDDSMFYSLFFDEDDNGPSQWKEAQLPGLWDKSIVEAMETKEYHRILYECIAKLSEAQIDLLQKKYFEGLSSEKICKDFNISKSNFWTSMHRINIQLRKCLELNWVNNNR